MNRRYEMDLFIPLGQQYMDATNPYAQQGQRDFAAFATQSERTTFLRQTYLHLSVAILAFIGLLAGLTQMVTPERVLEQVEPLGGALWIAVLAMFVLSSCIARYIAAKNPSRVIQYGTLATYVLISALLLWPLIAKALVIDPDMPRTVAIATLIIFGGMTLFGYATNHDYTWLGYYLMLGGLALAAFVVLGAFSQSGFGPGLWISVGLIVVAALFILYDTSNILHQYRTDQHIAASLSLFAAVSLLVWHFLRVTLFFRED